MKTLINIMTAAGLFGGYYIIYTENRRIALGMLLILAVSAIAKYTKKHI